MPAQPSCMQSPSGQHTAFHLQSSKTALRHKDTLLLTNGTPSFIPPDSFPGGYILIGGLVIPGVTLPLLRQWDQAVCRALEALMELAHPDKSHLVHSLTAKSHALVQA